MNDFFKNDGYWKDNISKKLNTDMWIDEYKDYFDSCKKVLDLGCGIGQYSKIFLDRGMEVISSDVSNIALKEVEKFNKNIVKVDMRENLPFEDNEFDLVFANLSIHYFDDKTTKNLIKEVNRILSDGGLFIGSVNSTDCYDYIKDTAVEIEHNFYFNVDRDARFFDEEDLNKYLSNFKIEKIEKKESTRFGHKKSYYIFIAKKEEIFDVYTRDGIYLGTKPKSICHGENPECYHKPVWIWIVNDKKQILIQKRAACKKNSPGKWDMPSAGHVVAGESILDGAVRETYEELGIKTTREDYKFLFEYIYDKNYEIAQVYLLKTNLEIKDMHLEEKEVQEVKWVSIDELKNIIYSDEFCGKTIKNYKDKIIDVLEKI